MSKSKKSVVSEEISVRPIASFVGESTESIVAFCAAAFKISQAAFINAAKAMIALEAAGVKGITKMLLQAGASQSSINNGRYMVRAYSYVTSQVMTEGAFDQLTYREAYALVHLAEKHGGPQGVHAKGWLSYDSEEWTCLHEHGMTVKDWEAAQAGLKAAEEKKAAAKAVADAAAKSAQAEADKAKADKAKAVAETSAADAAIATAQANIEAKKPTPSAPTTEASVTTETGKPASTTTPTTKVTAKATVQEFKNLLTSAEKMADEILANAESPEIADELLASIAALGKAVKESAEALVPEEQAAA
jgi:hypothetical protein